MATGTTRQVVRQLRWLALRETDALTDGQLLDSFISQHDEAAFAALVRRHGPMVWGVCRRVAGHTQDAEDAFQASFLVLARRAQVVRPRALVGHWLYGVAHRTALKARAVAARRRERERQVAEMPTTEMQMPAPVDWLPLLDRELERLPEKYRVPIVLCDLEGRTRREVARQLKLPDGTLSNRLATGRRMLGRRLARHGVALSAGALTSALLADANADVPPRLLAAAIRFAAENSGGAVSGSVIALSEGVIKTMLLKRLKISAIAVMLLGILGLGLGASVLSESQAETPPKPAAGKPKTDLERIQGAWVQLAVAWDGTLSTPEEVKQEGKRWIFHGNRFLATRASEPGSVTEVSFKLDTDASPKQLDYTIESCEAKGHKVACIYRLDDEFLIVRDDQGAKKRPKALRGEPGASDRLVIFGREGTNAKGPDEEFLKRICKEFRGDAPTAIEGRYFKGDADGGKRAKVLSWILGGVPHDPVVGYFGQTYLMSNNLLATQYLNVPSTLHGTFPYGFRDLTGSITGTLNYNVANPLGLQGTQWQGLEGFNSTLFVAPVYTQLAPYQFASVVTASSQDARLIKQLSRDLLGTAPTAVETNYFVADKDPKKREKLIDLLVKSDVYARRVAEHMNSSAAGNDGKGDRLGQLLDRLLADNKPDPQILEAITLAALARYPTETEKALSAVQVAKQPDRRAAWESILAALMQTTEAQQHIDGLNRRREK